MPLVPYDRTWVHPSKGLKPFYLSYEDAVLAIPDPRAGWTPTRTVTFTTRTELNTAVAGLTDGDLIKYTGSGVLDLSATGSSNGFSFLDLTVATKAVFQFGFMYETNHVKFNYTGTSTQNGAWFKNPTNLWFVGGEYTAPAGDQGILWYSGTNSGLYQFVSHDNGTNGLLIPPTAGPKNVTNNVFFGETYNNNLKPSFDSHVSDPGSGIHGANVSDGGIASSFFQGNTIALYAHDYNSASGIEFGDETSTITLQNNTFFMKVDNLKFSGSTIASCGLILWGPAHHINNVWELLQVSNVNGRATTVNSFTSSSTGGVTIKHGRATNTNLDTATIHSTIPVSGLSDSAPWDTRLPTKVAYWDVV